MVRILGIGDNTVDLYLDRGFQYPGGNAVNVAVQARRAGAEASYLGCLGTDMLGDLVHDGLVAEGVDVSRCRRVPGGNAWCRIRHDGNDRRFAGSIPGVRARYDLGPEDEAFMAGHDLAHTSGCSDLDGELARIRAHVPLLSYDYSERWARPETERTLGHVDIAFISCPKADAMECAEALRRFAKAGVAVAVATRGVRGSCALVGQTMYSEGIRPIDAVDTLGAGDAFIGGFLVSYLTRRDPAAGLAAGAEHAARACSYQGGFGHGRPLVPGQPGTEGT